eukprot:XP_014617591.1 uncharacterized protein LOC100784658 [Glycine max]
MNQDPLSSILRLLSERRLCKLSGTTDQNGFFEANLFHRDYEMEISHPAMKNYTCSFNSRSLLITIQLPFLQTLFSMNFELLRFVLFYLIQPLTAVFKYGDTHKYNNNL